MGKERDEHDRQLNEIKGQVGQLRSHNNLTGGGVMRTRIEKKNDNPRLTQVCSKRYCYEPAQVKNGKQLQQCIVCISRSNQSKNKKRKEDAGEKI